MVSPTLYDPEFKAFKLIEDHPIYNRFHKGRIFLQFKNKKNKTCVKAMASPTHQHEWGDCSYLLLMSQNMNIIEEIPLSDLLKIKPHWNKELYDIFKKFDISKTDY